MGLERTTNLGHELLGQTRSLWDICTNFEELAFQLSALVPLEDQPVEASELRAIKIKISTAAKLLTRRRGALLNHIAYTLRHHHVAGLTDDTGALCRALCTELLRNQPFAKDLDVQAPVAEMAIELRSVTAEQRLAHIRELVMRLEGALLTAPNFKGHHLQPFNATALFANRQLVCSLMEFDAYPHDFPGLTPAEFLQWLIYHSANMLVDQAETINLRTAIPAATITGLSGTAFIVTSGETTVGLINYRGAERSGQNGEWDETARDWQYMLQSVLLGEENDTDQLPYARTFADLISMELHNRTPNVHLFGLGHSLGGQLVQSVQLLDHPFTAGLTINSVPLQLRQLRRIAPGHFTSAQWESLNLLVQHQPTALNVEQLLPALNQKPSALINLGFVSDFTQLFASAAGTISIGTTERYSLAGWAYPFTGNLRQFLSPDEMHTLMTIIAAGLERLRSAKGSGQLVTNALNFVSATFTGLARNVNDPHTVQFLNHVFGYLYACNLFRHTPVPLTVFRGQARKKRVPWRIVLATMSRQREFFRSLNRPLFDTMVTMHIVNGAKFMLADMQTHWPVVKIPNAVATKLVLPMPSRRLSRTVPLIND